MSEFIVASDGLLVERIQFCGEEHWYLGSYRHNPDGPALITAEGRKEWWVVLSREHDPRGYCLQYMHHGDPLTGRYVAGCRRYTYQQAIDHWGSVDYPDPVIGAKYVELITAHRKKLMGE